MPAHPNSDNRTLDVFLDFAVWNTDLCTIALDVSSLAVMTIQIISNFKNSDLTQT